MWNTVVLCDAGSRKGSYVVIETAAISRAPIGCLAGDKLCLGLESPYLALPQMPEAATLSALPPAGPVPPPQSHSPVALKHVRTNILRIHQPAPSGSFRVL